MSRRTRRDAVDAPTEPVESPAESPAQEPAQSEPQALSELRQAVDAEAVKPAAEPPKRGPQVRAKETGFYAGHRRRPGAVFRIGADETVAFWMELVAKDQA